MIASGMIRKIDLLGRIVIPKEIRKSLKIESGDDIEMYIENESIILKKYQAMDNNAQLAKNYCNTIYDNLHINCFICSKEKIIASTYNSQESIISDSLLKIIIKGDNVVLNDDETIPLMVDDNKTKYKSQCIAPINCMGDLYGGIIAINNKNNLSQSEIDFIYCASRLLCGQIS